MPLVAGPEGGTLLIAAEKADPQHGEPFGFSSLRTLEELFNVAGYPFGAVAQHAVLPATSPIPPDIDRLVSQKCVSTWVRRGDHWVEPQFADALQGFLDRVARARPNVVVALDDFALYALTGLRAARKWRGSVLRGVAGEVVCKVIPTLSPQALYREWELRETVITDLKRAVREDSRGNVPLKRNTRYILRPDFLTAYNTLKMLLARLDKGRMRTVADIETRAGHISCIGIGWSNLDAICIPLMCVERPEGYWPIDQELIIMEMVGKVLTHPNCDGTLQNGSYDQQYTDFWYWFTPNLQHDTLITQHAMFSWSKKSLDYLASLYADPYVYWKDDGKNWDPSMPEDDHWFYNCEDLTYTWEVRDGQEAVIESLTPTWPKLPEVVAKQNELNGAVLRMMKRGVRTCPNERAKAHVKIEASLARMQSELEYYVGAKINVNSPKQMNSLFYDVLQMTPVRKRNANGIWVPSTDDASLQKIAEREPLVLPITDLVSKMRSARVFDSTFVQMPMDRDGRIRCMYKVGGTGTYRFASTENAFGSGGNLQNIPEGDEDVDYLPNVRKFFLPDEGMTWFDLDGDSADLRFVTWDCDCTYMKKAFAAGKKPYVEVAKEYYQDDSITKNHPKYKLFKAFCHATNYLGEPEGLAPRLGLPAYDIAKLQAWYFGLCPEIRAWQEDIKQQVSGRGFIENTFGYRCYFPGRVTKKTYGEAVAWKPQSSVAVWVNRILGRIDAANLAGEEIFLLLQVHDSLDGQFPTVQTDYYLPRIKELATFDIETPSGNMTIPVGLKTSTVSWGDCK